MSFPNDCDQTLMNLEFIDEAGEKFNALRRVVMTALLEAKRSYEALHSLKTTEAALNTNPALLEIFGNAVNDLKEKSLSLTNSKNTNSLNDVEVGAITSDALALHELVNSGEAIYCSRRNEMLKL